MTFEKILKNSLSGVDKFVATFGLQSWNQFIQHNTSMQLAGTNHDQLKKDEDWTHDLKIQTWPKQILKQEFQVTSLNSSLLFSSSLLQRRNLKTNSKPAMEIAKAVWLSRPDESGRARIPGHLGKIARITPGFLWFCPDFCDLVQIQSVIELFVKRQNEITQF